MIRRTAQPAANGSCDLLDINANVGGAATGGRNVVRIQQNIGPAIVTGDYDDVGMAVQTSVNGNPNGNFLTTLSLSSNVGAGSYSLGSLVEEEVDYALPATDTAGTKAALLLVLTANGCCGRKP